MAICKGKTKNGAPCKNLAIEGSSYCRIHAQSNKINNDNPDKNEITQIELRKRTTEEDSLLGARTAAFLLCNGFLMTARSVSNGTSAAFAISFLGFSIAIMWLITSAQSWKVITALHKKYHELFPNDPINALVFRNILWEHPKVRTIFGPTELISLWLPGLTIFTWIVLTYLGIMA